jgi:pimeloyl-ACP methyl ester carboxylesterase
MKKLAIGGLLGLALTYLGAFAGLAVAQRGLLYHPRAELVAPAQAGLADFESLRLTTEDGERLEAWHKPPRDASFPLILYFHGNGGALADRASRFRALALHGDGVLVVSYRGYGDSTGEHTEDGLMRDAEAAYAKARKRGFTPARIVLWGESLGTTVATMLASRREAAALVLDSPFASVVDVAASRYPIFPVELALLDAFHADEAIGKVRMPVFMAVGEADEITPADSARRLFARANQPKIYVEIPGGGHVPLGRAEALAQATAWLDGIVKSSPARGPEQ